MRSANAPAQPQKQLIETNLAQTPSARIANMERQLLLVQQLQRAKREQEAGR